MDNFEIDKITPDEATSENILSDAVFNYLFSLDEVNRKRESVEFAKKAKKFRQKKDFEEIYKLYEKQCKEAKLAQQEAEFEKDGEIEDRGQLQHFFGKEIPKYTPLYCGAGWKTSQNGIFLSTADGFQRICHQPVTILSFFKNAETGEEKVRIAFARRKNQWVEVTPNRSVIASNTKIVGLADTGLAVNTNNSREFVKYFADLESNNACTIPTKVSTSKLGWIKSGDVMQFVPYDTSITFDGAEKFRNLFASISEHGDKEAWIEKVKAIRSGRIEPRIALAASFSSVLLSVCNLLPYVLNIHGQTEGGKTVTLMMAASVWGNPDKDGGYLGDFSTTTVAIETRADTDNNLPLFLDDSSKVSRRIQENMDELVYTLCSGTGKDRSNQDLGLRRTNNWTNCTITNGEHPLVTEQAQGGAINRVLEVECDPGKLFEDGHEMAEFFKENYGFGGRIFVDELKKIGKKYLKVQQNYFFEKLVSENPDALQRQCHSWSAIILADQIMDATVFHDGAALTTEEIAPYIKSTTDVSENEKCLEYLYEKVAANESRFVHAGNKFAETPLEVWGRIDMDEDDPASNMVYIIKNVFEKLCKDGNFSAQAFITWAKLHDKIVCSSDRPYKRKRINGNGSSKPVWALALKYSDPLDDFEEIVD